MVRSYVVVGVLLNAVNLLASWAAFSLLHGVTQDAAMWLAFVNKVMNIRGTRWRSWLRHCATSWKVAGSIPDDVIGIFH